MCAYDALLFSASLFTLTMNGTKSKGYNFLLNFSKEKCFQQVNISTLTFSTN